MFTTKTPIQFERLIAIALVISAITSLDVNAALTVSTNFEGGSALVLALNSDMQTVRITPGGNPSRGWPCWWFARIDGITSTQSLTLEVVGSTATVTERGTQQRTLTADWSLPVRAAISTNGITWERTEPGTRQGKTMVYQIKPPSKSLWVAWGPPFTLTDARAFVTNASRSCACAKPFTLARSREGHDVPALQISEGDKPSSQRPAVWILSRQHTWEVGGTWVGVGVAEWLLGNDPRAKALRANNEFFFVPVMDADHVMSGDGGKDSLPQDHNRDWSATPHWPEVAAVQQRISEQANQHRMTLLIDLHNPGASSRRIDLWITPTNLLSAVAGRNQQRLFDAIRSEARSPLAVKDEPHWDGPSPEHPQTWHALSCPWVYEHANPATVAITMETPWNVPSGTTQGYREIGANLGRAIARYMSEREQ